MLPVEVAVAIEGFTPRVVSRAVATFAKELTGAACPQTLTRAKAFLFAASKLGAFCESVGLPLDAEVALHPSVIERCCTSTVLVMSGATRRTLRTNLRAIARRVHLEAPSSSLSRERAKAPYTKAEIASYLALADAQPTASRRLRAQALICLGAGAGLVGADLKALRGTDVVARTGGLVACVRATPSPGGSSAQPLSRPARRKCEVGR